MSPDRHEQLAELIPGYALGALDPSERERFERHLRDCAACKESLSEYSSVASILLELPRPVVPRSMLRQSLAASLRVRRPAPETFGLWRRATVAFAAGFLVMIAASTFLVREAVRSRSVLASVQSEIDTNQTALAINSYPTTRVASLEGDQAFGTFMFDPERTIAVLYAWGLPNEPDDVEYAAWLRSSAGERVNVGVFPPDGGGRFTMVVLRSPGPISDFDSVGVSQIDAQGEASSDPILFASFEEAE